MEIENVEAQRHVIRAEDDINAIVPEAACARVALLEPDGEHVVEAVALTSGGRPNTKEVVHRSLALKLVVEMADVELTHNLWNWLLKFPKTRARLLLIVLMKIVLHEHHRIQWVI